MFIIFRERTESHQFRKQLSYDGVYLPVKLNSIRQSVFEIKSPETEMLTDRQLDKRTKNGQTNGQNYTNFASNLATMVVYSLSSLNLIGQSVLELESGNRNVDIQKWANERTELHRFRKQPS